MPAESAASAARSLSSAVGSTAPAICWLPIFDERQQLFDDQALRDDRLELVVDDVGGVDFFVDVAGDDALRQLDDAAVLELEQHAGMVAGDFDGRLSAFLAAGCACSSVCSVIVGGGIAAAHQVAALAADGFDVDFLVGVAGIDELEGGLEDVGVECAGKALVAADDDEQHALFGAGDEERVAQVAGLGIVDIDAARERLEHAGDHFGVRPRGQRPLLRAAQLGRRDHLHGLGDLPRVFHAADAAP